MINHCTPIIYLINSLISKEHDGLVQEVPRDVHGTTHDTPGHGFLVMCESIGGSHELTERADYQRVTAGLIKQNEWTAVIGGVETVFDPAGTSVITKNQ